MKFAGIKCDTTSRKTNRDSSEALVSLRGRGGIAKEPTLHRRMDVYTSAGAFVLVFNSLLLLGGGGGAPCHGFVSAIQGDNYVISMGSQLDIVSPDDIMK